MVPLHPKLMRTLPILEPFHSRRLGVSTIAYYARLTPLQSVAFPGVYIDTSAVMAGCRTHAPVRMFEVAKVRSSTLSSLLCRMIISYRVVLFVRSADWKGCIKRSSRGVHREIP